MTLHFHEGLDLAYGEVLAISKGNELIEGAEKFVCISRDFPLVQRLACASDDLGKQVQRVDVLQDVGLPVRDEDHVELVQGLIYESNIILFHGRMLSTGVCKLGKRREESFNSGPGHLTELSGKDSFSSPGADGGCEDNLEQQLASAWSWLAPTGPY